MEKVLVQGDFNAHFDIKNASPCFAVLRRASPCFAVFYELQVTIAWQVLHL